ncbi:hypothetical protein B0H14DRAFT_2558115 [Mycena olivaceomarginata]|nr:hypothetical protein B0H14DRAFT_2558115 [Mycena olivaceomarginata]
MSATAKIVDEVGWPCENVLMGGLDFSQSLFGHFVGGEQNNLDVGEIYGTYVFGSGSGGGGDSGDDNDDTTTKKPTPPTTTTTHKSTTAMHSTTATHSTSTTTHISSAPTSPSQSPPRICFPQQRKRQSFRVCLRKPHRWHRSQKPAGFYCAGVQMYESTVFSGISEMRGKFNIATTIPSRQLGISTFPDQENRS